MSVQAQCPMILLRHLGRLIIMGSAPSCPMELGTVTDDVSEVVQFWVRDQVLDDVALVWATLTETQLQAGHRVAETSW